MLKLKLNHTPRDVKVLTDQLVDKANAATPFMTTVLGSADASAAQANLGISDFAKSLLDDADASTALSTLGVSSFAKTLLDDTDAASARATLGAMSQAAYDNRKQYVPKNLNYNGDFYWHRIASSATSDNIGPPERWYCGHNGSTKTASIQEFSLGQTDVPGFPMNYLRTVVTSVAGSQNCVFMQYPLDGVQTLAGKTATVTFWAKADGNRPIAAAFTQFFSFAPGASDWVHGIGATKFNLTTSWQKCQIVVAIPSIAGKTLGDNSYAHTLDFRIWFDAGSDFNSRTLNLGQQSGTFDIAHLSIVEGDASDVADPFWGYDFSEELNELNRYYYFISGYRMSGHASTAGGFVFENIHHPERMRTTPDVYFYSTSYTNGSAVSMNHSTREYTRLRITGTAVGAVTCTTGVEFYSDLFGHYDN